MADRIHPRQPGRRLTQLPPSRCPFCDALLDGASSLGGWHPEPGDLSVCIICASILRFDAALHVEPVTPDALRALEAQEPDLIAKLRAYQRVVRQLDRRKLDERRGNDPISDAIRSR
jgi:hypothetical protein